MAVGEIKDLGTRLPDPKEAALLRFFAKLEETSVDNLEAGARQVMQLVTALNGVIFGVLALGAEKVAHALQAPLVTACGALAVLAFLVALVAALAAVVPGESMYRGHSLDDMKSTYDRLLRVKVNRMYIAVVAFGVGAVAFAVLVLAILFSR